jgi:aldehyde dehydrogenase (NAD+)
MGVPTNDDFALMNKDIRASFASGINQSYESRIFHLELIRDTIRKHYDEACDAIHQDLQRNRTEAQVELEIILSEIASVLSKLQGWMKPKDKSTPLFLLPARTEVRSEPYGVVLIIGAYHYPLQLCLLPLIGAIAAGNVVIIKPSDQACACASWLLYKFAMTMPKSVVRVVIGDTPRTISLLAQPYDFIFYTGSRHGARLVSHAAAEYFTETCLQLGGKSPVYVDDSYNHLSHSYIHEAAKRIVAGKFHNCGQSCVSPDYVLVHESVHDELVKAIVK